MKKVLLFALLGTTIFASCKSDKKTEQIKANISKKALNMDVDLQDEKLTKVYSQTAETSRKALEEFSGQKPEEAFARAKTIMENAKENKDAERFSLWKWHYERIAKLLPMKPQDVEFTVYQYDYTVKNILTGKGRIPVSNYYFFDGKDSLLTSASDMELNACKDDADMRGVSIYEIAYINAANR